MWVSAEGCGMFYDVFHFPVIPFSCELPALSGSCLQFLQLPDFLMIDTIDDFP